MNDNLLSATICDIKRYTIQDGPGIRSTVFFKGCPLHCLWCSNPESIAVLPELAYNREKCLFCGECQNQCGQDALSMSGSSLVHQKDLCKRCQKCAEVCYSKALCFAGKLYTLSQLILLLEKDNAFYQRSKGGVTLSGGEPLLQADFVIDLLKELKNKGIHTAIVTTGFGETKALKQILKIVDLVLFDIKHSDPDIHKKLTGKDNKLILKHLEMISKEGVPLYISVPLIPGINDDEKNLSGTAAIINNLSNVERIRMIPYHRLGASKYEQLSRPYSLEALHQYQKETMDSIVQIFKNKLDEKHRNNLIII